MSVYPRKNGIYVYDFEVKGLRFFGSTGLRSKRAAEEFERAKRKEAAAIADAAVKQRAAPMTINAATDKFWEEVGDGYAGTYRQTVFASLGWLVKQLGKNTVLRDIGPSQVNDAIAARRGEGVSNATVNRTVTELLRRILKRSKARWGQTIDTTIEWADMMLPEPKERIRELREAEEIDLRGTMRADYLPAIAFVLASGCRLAEPVALRWSHIDWKALTVTIHGKGDKRETIPLGDELRAILAPLRGHHPEHVFTYVGQRTRKNPKTGKTITKGKRYPITYEGLKTAWRRHGAPKAKVEDFRFHDMRHTAATRLLRETGNLKLVQRLLRHEHITTTVKYAHADLDDLRAGMNRVSKSRQLVPHEGKAKTGSDEGSEG
jgi:integrase